MNLMVCKVTPNQNSSIARELPGNIFVMESYLWDDPRSKCTHGTVGFMNRFKKSVA